MSLSVMNTGLGENSIDHGKYGLAWYEITWKVWFRGFFKSLIKKHFISTFFYWQLKYQLWRLYTKTNIQQTTTLCNYTEVYCFFLFSVRFRHNCGSIDCKNYISRLQFLCNLKENCLTPSNRITCTVSSNKSIFKCVS